jgi:hypothetical protein
VGKLRLKISRLYDKETPTRVAQTKTWRKFPYCSRKTDQVSLRSSLRALACRMEHASEFMLRVLAMFVPPLLTNEHKQELVLDEVRDSRRSARGSFAQRNGGETREISGYWVFRSTFEFRDSRRSTRGPFAQRNGGETREISGYWVFRSKFELGTFRMHSTNIT